MLQPISHIILKISVKFMQPNIPYGLHAVISVKNWIAKIFLEEPW